jgi:hypothetical protein
MRPLIRHLLVIALYALIVVIVTWPLATDLSGSLIGFIHGDAHENAHHIWWFKHALQTGQPLFFQPLLGYPDGIEGVTLWANPLQFFPAWLLAFILPLPLASNLVILGMMIANGWAMYVLARYLLLEPIGNADERSAGRVDLAAFGAGVVFMLYPTLQGHLAAGHAGLMVQFGVPLSAYALLRLRQRRGIGAIAFAALMLLATAGGHALQIVYAGLPIGALIALWLLIRREWAALGRVVLAGMIAGAAMIVFLLPVFRAATGTSAYADRGDVVRYSSDLLAITAPSFRHPLYQALEYPRRSMGVNLEEGAAYFGIVVLLLAAIAVVRVPRARPWLWLGLGAYLLALGPLLKIFDQPVRLTTDGYESLVALPFAAIADLPLIALARTPGRFNFALALAAAALAGYGLLVILRRLRDGRAAAAAAVAIAALIAFDYQTFWPLPTFRAAIPDAIAALRARDDIRAVFDVPWDNLIVAKTGLYLQTAHQHALIAGQVTRVTPVNPAMLTLLEATLDPALLRARGVDVVIIHRDYADAALIARAQARLGAPLYADERFIIHNVPPPAQPPPDWIPPELPEAPIDDAADAYLYAGYDGFAVVDLRLTASGDQPRAVDILLDSAIVRRGDVGPEAVALTLPLPVTAGAYHTLRLQLDPPCPLNVTPGLACRSIRGAIAAVQPIIQPDAPAFAPPLLRAAVPLTVPAGGTLTVDLAWQFDREMTENDIRYVHVLDASGALVAQDDRPVGARPAGSGWIEQVALPLADLPPGMYAVRAGWYRYPEIAPLFGGPQDLGRLIIDAP